MLGGADWRSDAQLEHVKASGTLTQRPVCVRLGSVVWCRFWTAVKKATLCRSFGCLEAELDGETADG